MVMPDAGVMQFFKRMDIGSLDIGDYLGTSFVSIYFNMIFIIQFLHCSYLPFAAIGAIFAATDSVCTLQVWYIDFITVLKQL